MTEQTEGLERGALPNEETEGVAKWIAAAASDTVYVARDLVQKWIDAFGFGHYKWDVIPMQRENAGKFWARAFFDHDEEWFEIEVVPDGVLQEPQVEFLVCHELAHGLFDYADSGDGPLESFCNRVARLLSGHSEGANYSTYGTGKWRDLPDDDDSAK